MKLGESNPQDLMEEHHHHIDPLLLPTSPLGSSWPSFISDGKEEEEESLEEVRQVLLYTSLELESTRLTAHQEIRRLEEQLTQFRQLLEQASQERDEARAQCHHALLLIDKQQKKVPPIIFPPNPQFEIPPNAGGIGRSLSQPASSSASEESSSIVSSSPIIPRPLNIAAAAAKLPEKGKLLEAVMKAGPLLQTLMLAGPLPQWRHPPPTLRSFEIPPVSISINKKREREGDHVVVAGFDEGGNGQRHYSPLSSSSPPPDGNSGSKYQKTGDLHYRHH